LRKKIQTYLNSGVKAVWVAYPELRLIDVYTAEGVRRLESGDVLTESILPGFSIPVADFFRGI
jgi:Uma2 family endonuclease